MKLVTLRALWDIYNRDYFASSLHPIPILLTRARAYWGKYEYHESGARTAIYISGVKNKSLHDFEDSLKHEMIHQYLREVLGEPDGPLDHGPKFLEFAQRLQIRLDCLGLPGYE